MLPNAGVKTRVWREVEALGAELRTLKQVAGDSVPASVAIVLDWESWWSIGPDALPSHLDYLQNLFGWYAALQGGHLVVTYQSGITDENSRIVDGGYLGRLQSTLGIWVEEFAPLASPDLLCTVTTADAQPTAAITGESTGDLTVHHWTEVVHAADADVMARFVGGVADGGPALTRRGTSTGGAAWYVATQPDAHGTATMIDLFVAEAGVSGILQNPVDGVELASYEIHIGEPG